MGHEGKNDWSCNPGDNGGETYGGISRKANPDWPGWKIIDESKKKTGFPKNLTNHNAKLESLKQDRYKKNYWDVFNGDSIESQIVANEIFDSGVNFHPTSVCRWAQASCNRLMDNMKSKHSNYPLTIDGNLGTKSINVINFINKNIGDKYLWLFLNIQQGSRYIEIMTNNKTQERFIGWFNRVEMGTKCIVKNADIIQWCERILDFADMNKLHAAPMIKQGLNILNKNQKLWKDISVTNSQDLEFNNIIQKCNAAGCNTTLQKVILIMVGLEITKRLVKVTQDEMISKLNMLL
jgi:lysozyme family protein